MTTPIFVNNATLDYDITFVDGTSIQDTIRTGSHDKPVYAYYQGLAEPQGTTLSGFQHEKDAEKQAVNILANRLYDHLGCTTTEEYRAAIRTVRKGTVTLFSTMGPCHSCRAVIRAFVADFPTLTMVVGYRNRIGNGTQTAKLIKAGDGLHGAYGYGEADQRPNGDWEMIFAGTPIPATMVEYAVQFTKGPLSKGALTVVAAQPYTPYLYRVPGGHTFDADTVALDRVARAVRDTMDDKEDSGMAVASFRHFVVNVGSGTVTLTCEQGPTADGRASIAAFIADFPKVKVIVTYPGDAASGGGLGYADATRAGGATRWRKVFPAAG